MGSRIEAKNLTIEYRAFTAIDNLGNKYSFPVILPPLLPDHRYCYSPPLSK